MARTIIFKAIEQCNANCIYCDVIQKQITHRMNFDLSKTVYRRIDEFLIKYPYESIDFLWHGGEVCLLGADYFRTAMALAREICKTTYDRINYSVQSNLTAINQDIIDAFMEMGMKDIGTSYDLFPEIRGMGQNRDATKYNEMFYKGLSLLRANNMLGSVIYVVHKKSLDKPLEIFHHLSNLFYDSSIQFNIIHIYGEDKYDLSITDEQFAHFLGEVFTEWWKYRYTYPQMSSFRDYYYAILNGQFISTCNKKGSCANRWLYIDPFGEAKHCCEGDYGHPGYGTIQENTLEELYTHSYRDHISTRQYTLPRNECKGCRFWGVCNGGCPWGSKVTQNDFSLPHNCESTKIFLEQYFEPVTGLKFDFKPFI